MRKRRESSESGNERRFTKNGLSLKNREEHPDNESSDAQLIDLVYLVCLVCLVQPANKIDQTDRIDRTDFLANC